MTTFFLFRYASEVKGEFYMFIDISECAGKPTLLALVSGTVARTLENCLDEDIVSEAMKVGFVYLTCEKVFPWIFEPE